MVKGVERSQFWNTERVNQINISICLDCRFAKKINLLNRAKIVIISITEMLFSKTLLV